MSDPGTPFTPGASRRILVVGATGPTGREILNHAGEAGLGVRALARNPSALDGAGPGVEVVQGDALDAVSLVRAVRGVDAVVSALGTPLVLRTVTLLSEGTRNLVAAMKEAGVSRLVCITGMGAGDSRGHGGFVYDRLLLPLLLGRIYADKDRQEAVVSESGLDWVIVRPARLVNTPGTGRWREIERFSGERMTTISRADVADLVVREVLAPRHHRQVLNLTA